MRVIGGEFRSRVLKSVPMLDTRPTPDRLRETLFNILGARIEGKGFADLYAGTGAVGIEALSRGAARGVFVEQSRAAAQVIRENLKALGIEGRAEVRQARVSAVLGKIAADIVFIDPPYALEREYGAALAILGAQRVELVVVQHDRRLALAGSFGALKLARTLKQGDNVLSFFVP
jgi:16S rRNA (guanine966-N2)-methyltransferase